MSYAMKIRLPDDRTKLGQLQIEDTLVGVAVFGPISCYGKADSGTARTNGNTTRDPRQPFGDTPLGGYDVTGTMGPDDARYGQFARLVLVGKSGDAVLRESHDPHLRIHGGPISLGAALLRPTNGCVRVLDVDMKQLLDFISANMQFPFSLVIDEGSDFPLIDGGDDDGYFDPNGA
ncbi:MAG: hypothetical protein M3N82_01870 [Pseudomonadota bacterium]|nr:hypothetical protein [Pseudomonadota bacterium]